MEGRYKLLMPLGAGAMGEVFFGVLHGVAGYRRPVVLKRARPSESGARAALIGEARVASALNHPNVVHVYELCDGPDGLVLAMEYLPGVSLRSLTDRTQALDSTIPWAIGCRIVADAARGLHHAHRARGPDGAPLAIVHRDVNPGNLLVSEEGLTKVVDFGIARSTLRSMSGLVRGTLGYLSPEQASGAAVDAGSDVFSLGVVLHELLKGERLFPGATVLESVTSIMKDPIPDLHRRVPGPVADIVARMLVRPVERRSIQMEEVAEGLEAVCTPQGGAHRDVAALLRAVCGVQLEHRRALVRQVLGNPVPMNPSEVLGNDDSTLAIIDVAFDRSLPVTGTHTDTDLEFDDEDTVSRAADTEVD